MATGTVKWFNTEKGYGFIHLDGGDRDIFVHVSEIGKAGLATLHEGQRVAFLEEVDRTGRSRAVDIAAG
jgi:CspA family cold shock protein